MYYSLMCVCFVALVISTEGSFSGYGRMMRPCTGPLSPCRIRLIMGHSNGTLIGSYGTEMCSCPNQQNCPDWSTTSNLISQNLRSRITNMTMNMMFCQAIRPQNTCNYGQTAVILWGYMEIPTEIQSHLCNCESNQPLMLKRRWLGGDFRTYHAYVCGNHMPMCAAFNHCMELQGSSEVVYPCKCPGHLSCRERQNNFSEPLREGEIVHGYCLQVSDCN